MKFEYYSGDICLKVLNENYAGQVLDFYQHNSDIFNAYELKKPEGFYTADFQARLLYAEYQAFIHRQRIRFFLFDKTFPEKILGSVSFYDLKGTGFNSCTIGYKVDRDFHNKGYGYKMLSASIDIMSREFSLHRILAYVLPENTASIKLLRKLGFCLEGTAYEYAFINGKWRDHLQFSYIKSNN